MGEWTQLLVDPGAEGVGAVKGLLTTGYRWRRGAEKTEVRSQKNPPASSAAEQ
jgi:hypothetical protein